jgi:hypothetical protein
VIASTRWKRRFPAFGNQEIFEQQQFSMSVIAWFRQLPHKFACTWSDNAGSHYEYWGHHRRKLCHRKGVACLFLAN